MKKVAVAESKVNTIEENLYVLRQHLLDKKPSHFSHKDIARAFFGSLVFGFTFALKNILIDTALNLTIYHVAALILSTITIMTLEIYYIGYRRVPTSERTQRKFGQFWLKRISTYYGIALLVSTFLVYIYNLNVYEGIVTSYDLFRVIISISMPAGIGASIADLLKQY